MRRASARLDIVGRYNIKGIGGARSKRQKRTREGTAFSRPFYTANGQNRNFASIPITGSARLPLTSERGGWRSPRSRP